MGFASTYLEKHALFDSFIKILPAGDTSLIVVIPCFNEPEMTVSLDSLFRADRPSFPVEVIVVVNCPEGAGRKEVRQNRQTILRVNQWSSKNSSDDFMVHVIDVPPFPKRHAGAGSARKTGMDEAVRRFSLLDNENGIIVSFDADSVCDTNYFTELEKCFSVPGRNGCTIYFEHPLSGEEGPPEIYDAVAGYELYLRYYAEAMRVAGFPWAFHTIGSCFAVKARIYTCQGGMNRRTAGEDFYFLHKIFPLGNFTELNTTRVVPSSRVSDRVPFGTGATIKRLTAGMQPALKTWPPESFDEISAVIELIPEIYRMNERETGKIIERVPRCMAEFLANAGFADVAAQIRNHTAGEASFRKRFFLWFNAFRILKFLNYARENCRSDWPVAEAASALLSGSGLPAGGNNRELLNIYRDLQRNKTWEC